VQAADADAGESPAPRPGILPVATTFVSTYSTGVSKLQLELKQSRPFPSLPVETFLNLVRTAELLRAREADLLRRSGLSAPQYNVLRILRGAGPDGHPCQEIGARMLTRVPDVTRLVDRLVAAGHVERTRSDDDRRVVLVRILRSGLDLLGKLDGPVDALPAAMFDRLSSRELRTLNDLLVKARGSD
jgi:DNA-binding MarR family transcriptional regulator